MTETNPDAAETPAESKESRLHVWFRRAFTTALVIGLGIQFVPYGWWHENPPVTQDAPWPNAESAAIAGESCYSCHSNETNWPLYSWVAPMSWLVRNDVEDGRDELNFSEWDRDDNDADDAIEMIEDGEMPPDQYTIIHRDAKLTDAERRVLIDALRQMDDDRDDDDNSGPGNGDDD